MKSEKALIKWFKQHIKDGNEPYLLDKNQASVVLDSHKNTLVAARAGSGKTRILVAKIAYLLAHQHVQPNEIIVFAFNRKAKMEINERLTNISFDGKNLFLEVPTIATTFHAFAYKILGGQEELKEKLITEKLDSKILESIIGAENKSVIPTAKQFISRAEQQFFNDYSALDQKIEVLEDEELKSKLTALNRILKLYHLRLEKIGKINFNQLMILSAKKLPSLGLPYKYILVDEYQDFSLLFLEQIRALRKICPEASLLAVGDDWQAINRFAGGDVEYFLNFKKYFPEGYRKIFIPTNYRSSKKIVKNANYFMGNALKDHKSCKSGNKKLRGHIYIEDMSDALDTPNFLNESLAYQNYFQKISEIISKNSGKTIKILHRNNVLNCKRIPLDDFCKNIISHLLKNRLLAQEDQNLISWSTVHRSKGLEADVVILLEVDSGKFPSTDKSGGLYRIFGDTTKTSLEDEIRLFYVALTRAKEKLYILSKTTKYAKENRKYNFLSYLEDEQIDQL